MVDLQKYFLALDGFEPMKYRGRITKVSGLAIESLGPRGSIGELCYIETPERVIKAEIEGFREGATLLMPLGEIRKISPGCRVTASGDMLKIRVGPDMTGRVLDGLGGHYRWQGADLLCRVETGSI
jgi:flagellum-specific ATP synthase